MARTKTYNHFCPVARSLEVIGEKWSLLIVRDLLRGPKRYTELLRGLSDLTPKWLSMRLRELEAAGIVEREQEPGRKEVRYQLTAKGRELAPVISALNVWGVDHAMRPPAPDELIMVGRLMVSTAAYLNARKVRLDAPATWLVRVPGEEASLSFSGERWSTRPLMQSPDIVVDTDQDTWARFLSTRGEEREQVLGELAIGGSALAIGEFRFAFGLPRTIEAGSSQAAVEGSTSGRVQAS